MAFDLEEHLREEHNRSPFSLYLKEIVYGGNDGIVTTFAIVAGFTGAQSHMTNLPLAAVLLFGFANLFADGVSMSLGNFLSSHAEKDIYRRYKHQEQTEIRHHPEDERAESLEILKLRGFSETDAHKLVEIYKNNPKYWLEFMMEKELEIPNPEGENTTAMATATFVSFVGFGLIPLMPYLFLAPGENMFMYSVGTTAGALILLGLLRWKVTQRGWVRSIGETLILGGVAASVAYLVGTFFRA